LGSDEEWFICGVEGEQRGIVRAARESASVRIELVAMLISGASLMDKIMVSGNLPEQFRQVKEKVEVYDEAGQLLGYFVTSERLKILEMDRKTLYDWANSLITDEELDAAENDPIEYTTQEVFRHLEDHS
jgi:hypothetical protein